MTPPDGSTFDYIIVGAGSAGCVLANRLTASGRFRVLLLEAGPRDTNPWIHIPLGYGKLFKEPSVNWLYQTVAQPELEGRRIAQPRGKVLGGSSSINGLVYIRGQHQDFDDWRDLGCTGWGWQDVLPYFRRSADQLRGEDEWHGIGGPLAVSDQSEPHPLCDAFIDAAAQAGHPRNADFNGASQEGAGYYQTTSRRGRRVSAAVAYLRPAHRRANLTVLTGALATRLLFEGRRATGVEWRANGQLHRASAGREVILSGGAINTPQLLQLSGVGPAALLHSLGIPVIQDTPGVGDNLQDHLQARTVYRATRPITLNDDMSSLLRTARIGLRYLIQRKGPLTVSAGYAGGFFRTEQALARPDIQAHFITFSTTKMGDKLHSFSGFTASSCQLRPQSRGTLNIVSRDPDVAPAIDPNYLDVPADRAANIAGLRLIRDIMSQPAMAGFVAEEMEPGPAWNTDDDLLDYIRQTGSSLYHPTCTVRMGGDDGAVLDPALRVRGLASLRVVDGSVMPTLLSGNTNAGIVMIAEKAADLIMRDVGQV
ncbi:MAG: choline dehydrogenase [Sphingomicrobium sp.]